ncbi:hypothetical protein ACFYKX_11205 [Cytobacillus sp. FJAT-54145]|uniref:Uncharacterized protein n=1 Tax=Cytobacillus spartinae TaxID=3299023 RepID=A0ABW6KEN0_9BACI
MLGLTFLHQDGMLIPYERVNEPFSIGDLVQKKDSTLPDFDTYLSDQYVYTVHGLTFDSGVQQIMAEKVGVTVTIPEHHLSLLRPIEWNGRIRFVYLLSVLRDKASGEFTQHLTTLINLMFMVNLPIKQIPREYSVDKPLSPDSIEEWEFMMEELFADWYEWEEREGVIQYATNFQERHSNARIANVIDQLLPLLHNHTKSLSTIEEEIQSFPMPAITSGLIRVGKKKAQEAIETLLA